MSRLLTTAILLAVWPALIVFAVLGATAATAHSIADAWRRK